MRIIRLDEEKKQNILEGLLKRDPNQYGQYADTVQQIVDDVRCAETRRSLNIQKNSTMQKLMLPPSG